MRLDNRDRRHVATMDMPSFCCIESARRPAERAKPTKMTKVNGATVFDFKGCSPMRLTDTTRTEKGRRLFASLLYVSWCAMGWSWSRVVRTRAAIEAWYVWGRVLGKLPDFRGRDLPNNVSNMINVVSKIARKYA
jgi:hypothetical protein